MHRTSIALALLLTTEAALADPFASPPDAPLARRDGDPRFSPRRFDEPRPFPEDPEPEPMPRSTVRIHTGPLLQVSDATAGGLYAALDVGARAAGVRFSGGWARRGEADDLAQYTAELWMDFGYRDRLHPLVGAGAGLVRTSTLDATGESRSSTLGVGVLRLGLEYVLPVDGTDARAGLSAIGAVPAVRGSDEGSRSPFVDVIATVGVGF